MIEVDEKEIKKRIKDGVKNGLINLPSNLRNWAEDHLIEPRKIIFYANLNIGKKNSAWLVTDHKDRKDSSYRVIYNEELYMFGLVVDLKGGTVHCLGYSGGFDRAIESM